MTIGNPNSPHAHACGREEEASRLEPDFLSHGVPSTLWGTETVLVVNNSAAERAVLMALFEQLGYRALEASSAAEAKCLARAGIKIHLLFLDQTVPEAYDLALARWFRLKDPECKTLVAASSLWELNYPATDGESYGFLLKPFTPMELAWMARRVLG